LRAVDIVRSGDPKSIDGAVSDLTRRGVSVAR
jgi:hypothetical protein